MRNTLITIVGPTAIGKTAYAISLAQKYHTHIISCDSRQCYRELNIGVARPTPQELQAAPHHFIANRSILQGYNAYTYAQESQKLISTLFQEYPILISVGGSGLYVQALCQGIALLPDPPAALRQQLSQIIKEQGLEPLLAQLKQLDPTYYYQVDRHNPARIQRALEVCLTAHRPYSELLQQPLPPRNFDVIKIGLTCSTPVLRDRIDRRTEAMVASGLEEEVRTLLPHRHLQTLNTVGYKEFFAYIDGQQSLQATTDSIKLNTWHYAKKQISFFKRDTSTRWYPIDALPTSIL